MSDHNTPHYEDSGIPQPYHLVAPSVMPLISAFAAGGFFTMMILFMHKVKITLGSFTYQFGAEAIVIGFCCLAAAMFFWWKDVIKEAYIEKLHGPLVKIGLRYGMALFIASEVMFFVAFFWAYFSSALYPAGGVWPPKGIHTIDPFDLPFVMTVILLLSGCTVTFAHEALVEGRRRDAVQALGLSVLLGILFTCFQAYEYLNGHFSFKDGIFPSTFFMATGFHGFHVLVGTIFLIVAWVRTAKGHFTKESHFGFEAAAWYWHFVDVVWLFLFTSVYWWGSAPQVPGAHG